ncbi:MAG TPA: hypothetical protein P5293_01390 [Bacteroidales bacterium]|nr:hypothetical protein [Bacteroidales bacterium]
MAVIFTVIVAKENENGLLTVPLGWFTTFPDASSGMSNFVKHIYDDDLEMWTYFIIEMVPEGINTPVKESRWFKWFPEEASYVPIKKPEKYKDIINFSFMK